MRADWSTASLGEGENLAGSWLISMIHLQKWSEEKTNQVHYIFTEHTGQMEVGCLTLFLYYMPSAVHLINFHFLNLFIKFHECVFVCAWVPGLCNLFGFVYNCTELKSVVSQEFDILRRAPRSAVRSLSCVSLPWTSGRWPEGLYSTHLKLRLIVIYN